MAQIYLDTSASMQKQLKMMGDGELVDAAKKATEEASKAAAEPAAKAGSEDDAKKDA